MVPTCLWVAWATIRSSNTAYLVHHSVLITQSSWSIDWVESTYISEQTLVISLSLFLRDRCLIWEQLNSPANLLPSLALVCWCSRLHTCQHSAGVSPPCLLTQKPAFKHQLILPAVKLTVTSGTRVWSFIYDNCCMSCFWSHRYVCSNPKRLSNKLTWRPRQNTPLRGL